MSVLVMTCPHCSADNMTFNVRTDAEHKLFPRHRSALAFCAKCDKPIVVMATLKEGPNRHMANWKLSSEDGALNEANHIRIDAVWPRQPVIDAPQNLPEKVLRAFMDAASARRASLWNPACGAYRRCMEIALKDLSPDIDAWKIEKRIDRMAAENRLTPAIQAWAHELRLDGNEAVHGVEDATQEMADQMHHLTYFLLTYLFTLPKQIEEARARRDGGE